MAGQQPGQGGFGQGFGQPFGQQFGQPFGQQPAASPAPFSFGAAPTPPPTSASEQPGFGFGQPPPQQQPTAGFGFGQPQPTTFGQQVAPPPSFGGGASAFPNTSTSGGGFQFSSAAPAFTPAAPRSFDFGSALRKQEQAAATAEAPVPAPIAFGNQNARAQRQQQKQPQEEEQEEEEAFDYEAAKKAALASMPSFQGTGGGNAPTPNPQKPSFGSARPPQPPSSARKNQSTAAAAGQQGGEDPVEVARRMQRANRFAPVSATPSIQQAAPPPSSRPPPGLSRPSSFNFSNATAPPGTGEADVGNGGNNDDDEYGDGVGGGRGPIIGTCEDMCPASERERRQNMSDIQIFERVDPNNPNLTSSDLAVRRFARTVDDPHPSEFRTRGALTRTMDYLRRLLDRTDVRFGLVHKFLWDRYRSIRQDLYIQNINDEFAINIFEEIVRFHVLCEHELCGEDQSGKLFIYILERERKKRFGI